MSDDKNQKTKAILLHNLNHNGKMLVLPNIWNPLSAALFVSLGYPAIATDYLKKLVNKQNGCV